MRTASGRSSQIWARASSASDARGFLGLARDGSSLAAFGRLCRPHSSETARTRTLDRADVAPCLATIDTEWSELDSVLIDPSSAALLHAVGTNQVLSPRFLHWTSPHHGEQTQPWVSELEEEPSESSSLKRSLVWFKSPPFALTRKESAEMPDQPVQMVGLGNMKATLALPYLLASPAKQVPLPPKTAKETVEDLFPQPSTSTPGSRQNGSGLPHKLQLLIADLNPKLEPRQLFHSSDAVAGQSPV